MFYNVAVIFITFFPIQGEDHMQSCFKSFRWNMDVILEQAKTSLERNVSEFMDVNKLEEWATLNGL